MAVGVDAGDGLLVGRFVPLVDEDGGTAGDVVGEVRGDKGLPVVTCSTPWPQSNEINEEPMEPKGTSAPAWVMLLSTQAMDLSNTGGTLPGSVERALRGPT